MYPAIVISNNYAGSYQNKEYFSKGNTRMKRSFTVSVPKQNLGTGKYDDDYMLPLAGGYLVVMPLYTISKQSSAKESVSFHLTSA